MEEEKRINPIRETDEEALALTAELVRNASFASLAVNDGASGHPVVSRIAFALLGGKKLVTLISSLSHHSQLLAKDPRCSLMVGEPGRGDPLAHPRITLIATASVATQEIKAASREAYLAAYPKAELYFDFGDFQLVEFDVENALLNGGFGKAFRLTQDEFQSALNAPL